MYGFPDFSVGEVVRLSSPGKQQFQISRLAKVALHALDNQLVDKEVAVHGSSEFSIDALSGMVRLKFTPQENAEQNKIRLALWDFLCTKISVEVFEKHVRIDHDRAGRSFNCFITSRLLSNIGDDIERENVDTSEKSAITDSFNGRSSDLLLDSFPPSRQPAITLSEQKNSQENQQSKLKKLVDIFRQLLILSRINQNVAFASVNFLNNNPTICDEVLNTLQIQKPELWSELATQLLSTTNSEKELILLQQLKLNPGLQDDLFIAILSHLNAAQDLMQQLVSPLLISEADLWGKLTDVFDGEDLMENYLALCNYCEISPIWGGVVNKSQGNSKELSQSFNELDNYYPVAIQVLYQYFLCVESERPGLGRAIQLFTRILGEGYQVACFPSPTSNTKTLKFHLVITPPPEAGESIVTLLIQKLHSLFGGDSFQNLIHFEANSDRTCALTLAANLLESFQLKLRFLTALSFDEVKQNHIDVVLERTCFGVLEKALTILQEKLPTNLKGDKNVFIKNFQQLVRVFVEFNEALVTDSDFRVLLTKKFGGSFNSEYVQRDVPRRMDALFIYLENRSGYHNLVNKTFSHFDSNSTSDKVSEDPLVLIFECLQDLTNHENHQLSSCFGILMNVWMNFGSYYESEILGSKVEIATAPGDLSENVESHSSPMTTPINLGLSTPQKAMAEVPTDSPVVRITRKDGQTIYESPASKSRVIRNTAVYNKNLLDTPYRGPSTQTNSEQRRLSTFGQEKEVKQSQRQYKEKKPIPFSLPDSYSSSSTEEEI